MEKLFLSSFFKDVTNLFKDFSDENLLGKTVTFIPTASITETVNFYVDDAKRAFEKLGMTVDELEVSQASIKEISEKLRKNDYIYVSGGNTFFLLQELKKKGADKIIIEQIHEGKPYIGESAGSVILSPNIEYIKEMDDHKKAPALKTFSALNIIDFYPLPHHTNFPFKEAVEKIITKYEDDLALFPISNSQAILINGAEIIMKNR